MLHFRNCNISEFCKSFDKVIKNITAHKSAPDASGLVYISISIREIVIKALEVKSKHHRILPDRLRASTLLFYKKR